MIRPSPATTSEGMGAVVNHIGMQLAFSSRILRRSDRISMRTTVSVFSSMRDPISKREGGAPADARGIGLIAGCEHMISRRRADSGDHAKRRRSSLAMATGRHAPEKTLRAQSAKPRGVRYFSTPKSSRRNATR